MKKVAKKFGGVSEKAYLCNRISENAEYD